MMSDGDRPDQICWEGVPFNEATDESGHRREAYRALAQQLGSDPLRPPEDVLKRLSYDDFGDGTRLLPIPLALDRIELLTLQRGIAQRAKALQHFFADVILDEGRILSDGVGLDEAFLDDIMVSEGTSLQELREWWRGQDRDRISFVYGPDLIRAPSGQWAVLEDNVGCVSGCADSFLALDIYLRAMRCRSLAPQNPDLTAALEAWLDRQNVKVTDCGVLALLTDGEAARWSGGRRQQEDVRREQLAREFGVTVVDSSELEEIACRSDTPFQEVRALINIGVPSVRLWPMLLTAFFRNPLVPMLNAPGTSVLGSKALLPVVGSMVQFYFGEAPILLTPPSVVLNDERIPADSENWVVKAAAGCAGTGVYHLRTQTRDQRRALTQMIAGSWPVRGAIAQRHVEASRLSLSGGDEHLVELRAVGYVVGWQAVFSGDQCLARLCSSDNPETSGIASVVFVTDSGGR
jgi:carboxylate-amine ligase